jgi:phage repressor protein C with HTH and peptisase S24 domain
MEPALREGQVVFAHHIRSFREGQVVVAIVEGREVIKRIAKIDRHKVYLQGDNSQESTDSRAYGPIVDTLIKGVVFWPRVSKK